MILTWLSVLRGLTSKIYLFYRNSEPNLLIRFTSGTAIFLAFLVPLFILGCVAPSREPSEARLASIRTIEIIPLEPPPLSVNYSDLTMEQYIQGVELGFLSNLEWKESTAWELTEWLTEGPELYPGQNVRFFYLSMGFLAIELLAAGRDKGERPQLLSEIFVTGNWAPTIILANMAGAQIVSAGQQETTPVRYFYRLPVSDRRQTFHQENWMAPIRRWYGEENSPFDYTGFVTPEVDAVLEIGLLNYELFADRFLVQVMAKLIDPDTKETLGRARKWASPKFGPTQDLVTDDGRKFRRAFYGISDELVRGCLKDIGLLPE